MESLHSTSVDLRMFGPGVYHLMRGEDVVYVGASTCLVSRVQSWGRLVDGRLKPAYREMQPLDGVRVFFADSAEQAAAMECEHIAALQPRFNRAGVDAPYMSPIGLWERRRRYLVEKSGQARNGEKIYHQSRASYALAVAHYFSLNSIRKLKLIPAGGTAEGDMVMLKMIGFPPPDYASNRGTPRWLKSTVVDWIERQGPFEDEIESAA